MLKKVKMWTQSTLRLLGAEQCRQNCSVSRLRYNQGATPGGFYLSHEKLVVPTVSTPEGWKAGWTPTGTWTHDHEAKSPTPTGIEPPTPRSRVQRVNDCATRSHTLGKSVHLLKAKNLVDKWERGKKGKILNKSYINWVISLTLLKAYVAHLFGLP